jgi:hypothetical protein
LPVALADAAAAGLVAALYALATGVPAPDAADDAAGVPDPAAAADAAADGADEAAADGAALAAGLVGEGAADPNGFAWPEDAGAALLEPGVLVADVPPQAARNAAAAIPSAPPTKARRETILTDERPSMTLPFPLNAMTHGRSGATMRSRRQCPASGYSTRLHTT